MLRPLQESFPAADYPDLKIGLAAPDDAAVWRLDETRLLVLTTDFFTPIVDDPYDYGSIAAANALSDLYAMGAVPFLALNIACLPNDLDPAVAQEIFRGLADTAKAAGAVIAGGHTIQDDEPKVGLVGVGFAEPDGLMTKGQAKPGDHLVLTKPIGTGLISTAIKASQAGQTDISQAVGWMRRLNAGPAALARRHGVRAATDVTGFSLLGHGLEMAGASEVRLVFDLPAIPLLAGAETYAQQGLVPGGSADNRSYFSQRVTFESGIPELAQTIVFDAQTSGGLLLAVPPDRLEAFLSDAEKQAEAVWVIGQVEAGLGATVRAQGIVRTTAAGEPGVVYWPST